MLRVQVLALVPLAIGSVFSFALLSLRRQLAIAAANAAPLLTVLLVGTLLVHEYAGMGAAATGVAAEVVLATALGVLLWRADPSVLPRVRFVWRPLVAAAAGAATLLVPLPTWVDGAAAGLVYTGVAFAVGAVPAEVVAALRRRAPGEAT